MTQYQANVGGPVLAELGNEAGARLLPSDKGA